MPQIVGNREGDTAFSGVEQIVAPCHRSWRNREGDTASRWPQVQFLRLWSSLISCSDGVSCDSGSASDSVSRRSQRTFQFATERVRFQRGYGGDEGGFGGFGAFFALFLV